MCRAVSSPERASGGVLVHIQTTPKAQFGFHTQDGQLNCGEACSPLRDWLGSTDTIKREESLFRIYPCGDDHHIQTCGYEAQDFSYPFKVITTSYQSWT